MWKFIREMTAIEWLIAVLILAIIVGVAVLSWWYTGPAHDKCAALCKREGFTVGELLRNTQHNVCVCWPRSGLPTFMLEDPRQVERER